LIETSHVACIVVFAGLVIMMDLRLVAWRSPMRRWRRFSGGLFPWQMAAFVPSTATGILLFCVDPLRYYRNVFFLAKLVLLALAGLNALAFHLKTSGGPRGGTRSAVTAIARWAALPRCCSGP